MERCVSWVLFIICLKTAFEWKGYLIASDFYLNNGGEVWRHVTMVALLLDDNKTNEDRDGKENGEK